MRRHMLAILDVFVIFGPTGTSVADRQDRARFGPLILAQDKNSFVPANPVGLDFVKEDVGTLGAPTARNRRRS